MTLVTTSIGQEGLDFHVYARRVVHWDLPSNAVDLEQRDGRIARFGSLAVRHALALSDPTLDADNSPWLALARRAAARESVSGLEPWWHSPGAALERVLILPSYSRQLEERDALEASLALYRLTLGQPDQEHLLTGLQRRVDAAGPTREAVTEWLGKAALCLSPFARAQATRTLHSVASHDDCPALPRANAALDRPRTPTTLATS
jgi:hypothetical protein